MHWTGSDTLIEGSIKGGRVFVFPTTVARNDLHRDLQKTTGAAIAEWSAKTPIDVAKAQYAAATVPKHCTKCGTHVAHTADWTLYPWPDGAELCSSCNDARHEVDDYTDVENAVNQKARGVR
jgi:hypothetical protein